MTIYGRILLLAAALNLSLPAQAANYNFKDNNGATFNINMFQCGSLYCTAMVLENSSGTELFTSGNAAYVQFPSPQSVSDATTHTDLATINSTLGSPFQAGGNVGNTGFNALQGGSANAIGNPFYVAPGTGATWAVTGTFWPYSLNGDGGVPSHVTNFPATQPISAASLPLPSGAAISADQEIINTWAGATLGAMANYGTSPGAVLVPGVNAFITNAPAVTQSSGPWTQNVTQFGGSAVVTGTGASGSGIPRVTVSNDSTVTANQGTANTLANGWPVELTDGTNGPAAVKPASTAPAATDKAVVVAISPNGINANGQATSANSAPVVLPSDMKWGSPSASVLGSYCMGLTSGTMAAALGSNSPIASFRYGGSNLALVRKVKLSVGDTATAFTAGVFTFTAFAARSFTASDSGGNAATLTGNNGKMRTSFATTGISDFRVSSTAALTAGTRTLDSTALGTVTSSDPATAGAAPVIPVFLIQPEVGEQPLQLATNEGFVVEATVPATGTWTFSLQVCWDEVTAY